jgi:hypothetical protein
MSESGDPAGMSRKRESRDFSLLPLGPRFRGGDEFDKSW